MCFRAPRTRTRALLIVLVGVAAAVLSFESPAQNVGSPEQVSDTSRLQQQVEELEARLKKLEEKFEKPLTVKAPFTVADGSGKQVFKVGDGGNKLTLGNSSSPILHVTDEGGNASLRVASGKASVGLLARQDGTAIAAAMTNENTFARLIALPGGGALTEVRQDQDRAYVGIAGGPRVKLEKAGKQFFLVDGAGDPTLKLGDDTNPALAVRDSSDKAIFNLAKGRAELKLHAFSSGHAVVDVTGGGQHAAQILAYPESTSIRVGAGGDDGSVPTDLIKLAFDSEGPHLTLTRGGKKSADLGTPEGKQTGLRIYDLEGQLALHAGLGMTGYPGFTVLNGDDVIAALQKSSFGEGLLALGKPGPQLIAELGRQEQGKETALRIYNSSEQVAVGVGIDSSGRPAVRVAHEGKPAASMSVDSKGHGSFEVIDSGRSLGSLSIDEHGLPAVQLKSASGDDAVSLTAETDGDGSLLLFKGDKVAAHLGSGSADNTALRIYGDGSKLLAGIGVDSNGNGAARVAEKSGVFVAGMQADPDGGGSVIAYHKSGMPAAALAVADGGLGSMQVYTTGGEVLATITQGENGGKLQLNTLGGVPMVEAGNNGRVGVVRAGPMMRSGGLLGLPGSFIMGAKGQ